MRIGLTANVSESPTASASLHWVLRLGVFMCFLGHGSYGIIAKPEWTPYFGVAGISKDTALHLMPLRLLLVGVH